MNDFLAVAYFVLICCGFMWMGDKFDKKFDKLADKEFKMISSNIDIKLDDRLENVKKLEMLHNLVKGLQITSFGMEKILKEIKYELEFERDKLFKELGKEIYQSNYIKQE